MGIKITKNYGNIIIIETIFFPNITMSGILVSESKCKLKISNNGVLIPESIISTLRNAEERKR